MGQRHGLEIRGAAVSDAPGLTALLAEMGAGTIPPPVLAGRLDGIARTGGIVLIALEWGPPSGVVALQVVADLSSDHPAGLLVALGVAPDARRRGIGRLLIKAVARSARLAGCDRLVLPIAGRSTDLDSFAAAAGFVMEDSVMIRPLLRRSQGGD